VKRTLMILAALAVIAACAGAQEGLAPAGITAEIGEALNEMSASPIGGLTVGDLARFAERVSVAEQKARYVQKARMASWMIPGAGQLMTGDMLGGSLFLAGDIALMAGTLIGAYVLLPANVQFSGIDYLNDPLSGIRSRWEGNSIGDYLPACGIMLGGMVLNRVLAHFSSVEAAKGARRNIAEGKITFTPNFEFLGRSFGMGMRMRF
jgi:hypothetical protein